uniref:Uncharacterized protein n=1 Tax=Anguilla anguilla TaxID=7936 RepID=A0A0E9XW45_ANGAN
MSWIKGVWSLPLTLIKEHRH